MVKRIVVWVCVLVLLLSTTTSVLANQIDSHKNEAQDVSQDIKETRELLDQVKDEQTKVAAQLKEIDKDLKDKEVELVHIEKKLDDTMALLDDTKAELEKAIDEANEFEELMADRLCAMYMMEGTSYLELLFGSKSLNEFLDRLEMVKFMITYDNQVFDKMMDFQNTIQDKKEMLEVQEETIKETKDDISKQKSLIEDKKQERLVVMAELKEEEQEYEKDLEVLEQTSRDLERTIQQLLKEQEQKRQQEEQKRKEEEQKRKEEEQRQKEEQQRKEEEQKKKEEEQQNKDQGQEEQVDDESSKGENKQETEPPKDQDRGNGGKQENNQDNGNNYTGGTLTWPAPGFNRITSSYGPRTHPVTGVQQQPHNGIDIGSNSNGDINGKNAVAAADGIVILSQIYGGYGHCVIIDHGGGITTVYAHGSQRLVSVGQRVTRGQAVMKIGSTGVSTGPHLHFEVRKNGSPVNPMSYLGR